MAMSAHTIVLIQPSNSPASRTYSDYETVGAAMDGICHLYEAKLKKIHPTQQNITYDITTLFQFLDGELYDLTALVFDNKTGCYVPHNKQWIKEKVFNHLKRQASR